MGRHSSQVEKVTESSVNLPHPKNLAAVVAAASVVVGGGGFAFNNHGGVQPVESNAQQTELESVPTATVQEESQYSDDQVVLSTVDYYRQVCPSLLSLTSVTHDMSVTVEEAVGKEGEELSQFWSGELHGKSERLNGAVEALSNASQENNVGVEPIDAVTGKTHEIVGAFNGYADTMTPENMADLTAQARTVAANQGVELSRLVQGVVDATPFPTTATANAVYGLEECNGVFNTGHSVDHPIDAALDFHKRIEKSASDIDETRTLIDNVEVTNDVEATKNAVADVWLKRAEAADAAVKTMEEWRMPDAPTQAELEALRGYVASKEDSIHVWKEFAEVAHRNEQLIRSATDSEGLNNALSVASDETWQQDVNEEKMLIRVNRVASDGRQAKSLRDTVTQQIVRL